jgi:hypothetical protein
MNKLTDELLKRTINRDVIGRLQTLRKIDNLPNTYYIFFTNRGSDFTINKKEAILKKLIGDYWLFGTGYSKTREFWDSELRGRIRR